jgi:electron transfer flavoprotein alpha subunit
MARSFIYLEPSEEEIDPVAKQIASRIRKVPEELRGPITGVLICDHLDGKGSLLDGYLDEIYEIEIPSKYRYNMEVISKILTDVIKEKGPGILFLGLTHQGMELGPAVGWHLGVPTITHCVSLDWMAGRICIKRPIEASRFLLTLEVTPEYGAVISIPKGTWKDEGLMSKENGPIAKTRLVWKDLWIAEKTEVAGIIEEERLDGAEDIKKAEILISVGRGLGSSERLAIVQELAGKLGGMISCSRPVVDMGWLPASRQVGISGKAVSPVIYMALGISGQANHLAGIDGSSVIIAVNKDPLAPIFTVARYGVLDTVQEFVSELLVELEKGEAA